MSDDKRKRLKLDPDLTDGQHWTIHDEPNDVLLAMLLEWMTNCEAGDSIVIELVAMTDKEAEALPDI